MKMSIQSTLKKIVFPHTYSSEAYIAYLKNKGIDIGKYTKIYSPNHTFIDVQKPELLHIGSYCKITSGVHILCHDYSMSVARRKYREHCGDARATYIGDNVFIGINSIILMGTRIGDNCIIGAGSVVSGHFGDNIVIAGNPAKEISTLERYYNKRKENQYNAACQFFRIFYEKHNRIPTIEEMGNAFAWMYLPRTEQIVQKYDSFFRLGGENYDGVVEDFLASKGLFDSYDEFVESIIGDNK